MTTKMRVFVRKPNIEATVQLGVNVFHGTTTPPSFEPDDLLEWAEVVTQNGKVVKSRWGAPAVEARIDRQVLHSTKVPA